MLKLTEGLESVENRDYLKLFKIIGIVAGFILILVLVFGFIFESIFYPILIYIAVLVSIIGYIGGIWLWEYLSSSELIKGVMKRGIKTVGIFALIGFMVFISFSVYIAFYGDFSFLQMIVTNGNYLLLFMFSYFIGYLLSIWNQSPESEPTPNSEKKSKVDWEIIKRVLKVAIPVCAVGGGIILVIGLIQSQIIEYLIYCGIFFLLVLGFCLGYLVWERFKKSNLITGEFQERLKWISVVATIALGALTMYGFWVVSLASFQLYHELILYYSIFLICMFFYFLGLYVSVIKSE